MAVLATAIWRVRPSGNNTNGGGYDPGIAGAATDYSQQNAAQAGGTNGATTGTTNFADTTANAFTAAMIGNAIYISGAGQTTGFYFVTAFVDVGNVTLDRSPGTGTGATWNLGGGWADFWTNCSGSAPSPLVPLNTVYILGSGTPNPASYTYDYTIAASKTIISGAVATGFIKFANDPGTPGYKAPPDTTGGMPTVLLNNAGANLSSTQSTSWNGLWFVIGQDYLNGMMQINARFFGCVWDTVAHNSIVFYGGTGSNFIGCEIFSSTTGGIGTYAFIFQGTHVFLNCNIHDLNIPLCYNTEIYLHSCILAKIKKSTTCTAVIFCSGGAVNDLINCTIDGNEGDGIYMATQANWGRMSTRFFNNIISNHTGVGAYGINLNFGSAAVNTSIPGFYDYNVFYNNTVDMNNLNHGPHDTYGGSDPYVAQSTENYTLK